MRCRESGQTFGIDPGNGSTNKFFTIKFHHGGKLIEIPEKLYVGGTVNHIDYCDGESVSLSTIEKIGQMLGYTDPLVFYYIFPKFGSDEGFHFILLDDDVRKMADLALAYDKEVEVYAIHTFSFTGLLENTYFHRPYSTMQDDNTCENDTGVFGEGDDHDMATWTDESENASESDTSDCESFYDSEYELSENDKLHEKHVDHKVEKGDKEIYFTSVDEEAIVTEQVDEISSEDELKSLCSDDENFEEKQYVRFNPKSDMLDPKYKNGMIFKDRSKFKDVVRARGVSWQRAIKFIKNDKIRVRAKCFGKNCPWVVLASKMRNSASFQIKTLNGNHRCGRTFSKNKFVTSNMLSKRYLADWRLHNGWKLGEFQEKVHNDLNTDVSKSQYYRTKRKVYDMLYGKYKNQYKRFYDYCEELRITNPQSTVVLKTETDDNTNEERFQRLYVCFYACKKGSLEGCRPVIGVDACHLKGPHKGVLLSAVGVDPNNCIFPICYCVAETEDKSSWKWFLELLQEDLQIYKEEKWTFISDRQKGLLPALYELLPEVEHRYCVRHMYKNLSKIHPGLSLKDRVWNLARASTTNQFTFQMDSLKEFDEKAYNWLKDVHPRHWSRSHFRTYPKCDILLNNMCESFNSTILEARYKPIYNMLEGVRIYIQKRLQSKRDIAAKWDDVLCPKVQKALEKLKDETRSCIAEYVGSAKFEVRDVYGARYSVNLDDQTCSCRKWQLTGIPCVHGVSAIVSSSREPEDYVDNFYSKETYLKTYGYVINPVKGPEEWPITNIGVVVPPIELRLPGRPKKARRREHDEPARNAKSTQKLRKTRQKTLACSICHQDGHNKRKCASVKNLEPAPSVHTNEEVAAPQAPSQPLAHSTCVQPSTMNSSELNSTTQVTTSPTAAVDKENEKKRRKCSVCKQKGHYKSKCPTPTEKMWQNFDLYGYNYQKDPPIQDFGSNSSIGPTNTSMTPSSQTTIRNVASSSTIATGNVNATPSQENFSAFTCMNPLPRVPQPPNSTTSQPLSMTIAGVSVKSNIKKKGTHCVTLSSLKSAASGRRKKQSQKT